VGIKVPLYVELFSPVPKKTHSVEKNIRTSNIQPQKETQKGGNFNEQK
jgi:hypothetical protein